MSSDSDAGASVAATEHDQLKQLGKYEILRKLGAGGMGTVFLAMDQDLRRTVALKVLPRDRAENAILVRRFKAEAQAAAQLHHRNIVGVYEAGQADGLLYIALEYIDGTDALGLIHRRGVLPVKRSIEIIRGVAEALQHAYEKNIVHRDIKPSNLMISKDGEVKLADMGLARSVDETLDTSITRAGTTVGTVDYMAPEQARDSKAADIRSDLYSLGCTWYHLITGEPPFGDGDVMFKVQAHALKAPPDPRRVNERIPDAVVAVIQRLMAKKPQERYQTPQDLIEDLANPNLHRQGVTSDLLASLGKSHDEEFAVDEEEEAPAPTQKGKTPSKGTTPAKKSSASSPSASAPAAKGSPSKGSKRTSSDREESLISRALDEEDGDSEKKPNRKKTAGSSDRKLPDRVDAKEIGGGISQMSIDPAFFQIGVVVLIVGAVIGAIAWILKSASSSKVDDKGSLAGIVQRNDALNAQPDVPMQSAAPMTPMPEPDPTGPVVPTVPTIKYTGPQDESPLAGFAGETEVAAASLPNWVPYTRGPAPDDVPVVKVRRFRTEPGEIGSVAQLGRRDKVVLEFVDEGPHTIPVGTLGNVKWLGIRGRNVRPALIVSGAADAQNAVFGGVRGSLKIEGVDLFWNVPDGDGGALLGSQGGDVLLRNTTITVAGAGRPAALQLRGAAGVVTRALLENVLIRNDRGTGIRAEGPGVELVTANLLSLTGGTFLSIDPADQAAAGQLPATRLARFFHTTAVTGDSLLTARHHPKGTPAAVDLRFEQFQGIRHGNESATAPAIRLADWPDSPADDAEAARPAGFKLQGTTFQFAGWGNLTQPPSGQPVTDAVSWRLFWRHQAPSDVFVAAAPGPIAAWNAPYSTLSADRLAADLRAEAGGDAALGCRLGKLPRSQEGLAEHIAAFASRPVLPTLVTQPAAGPELRFDLKKGATLNRFLNSECPDNARVVAFGGGIKFLEPVVLKKKSLTIVFEQAEGAPLVLQPQSKPGSEKAAPEAMFILSEGARLELVGARFEVMFSKGKQYPKRLAQTDGGALVLTRCFVDGPESLDAPPLGLLQATGAGPTQLLTRGTFLRGKGPLLELAGARTHLRLENSVLLSSGDAISLAGASNDTTLDMDSTTVAAAGASVRIAPDQTGNARLFVSESLFVPPSAGMASLVADEAKAAGSRIVWWGLANAYSSKLADFVVTDGHPAGKQEFDRDWVKVWGAGHDLRAASGEEAVVLEAPLGKLPDIKASDFTLKSGCLAAVWDGKGEPVGADVAAVGPPAGKGTAPAVAPKPAPGTPNPKPSNGF